MICSLDNLIKAYCSCRKHKRNSLYALDFESDWETSLKNLQVELLTRSYEIGQSTGFVITYPTMREIFAANFKDRVLHHLLISVLEPAIDPQFIYDSYACRNERGATLGYKRLHKFTKQITKNSTQEAFYLKLDVKSFFYSIDQQILLNILNKKITLLNYNEADKSFLNWASQKVIFHNPCENFKIHGDPSLFDQLPVGKSLFKNSKGKGLPIGNLTSQFFANLYLNELDQYVKRVLKVKYYLRYADDIVILSTDIKYLQNTAEQIQVFLENNLQLKIHPKKTKYGSVYDGIDFVGYIIRPSYVLARNKIVGNLKKKLYFFNQGLLIDRTNCKEEYFPLHAPPTGEEIFNICASINSLYGHLKWADSYKLRQNIYLKHFGVLENYLDEQDNFAYFSLRGCPRAAPEEKRNVV